MNNFTLPKKLYMRRKSFELGTKVLLDPSIKDLTELLLSQVDLRHRSPADVALETFWAREHSYYLQLCKYRNRKYVDYLPGRVYTYQVLSEMIIRLAGTSTMSTLEAGCGSGLACSFLALSGATATGLDISRSALIFARGLALDQGAHIKTVAGNWIKMPFDENTFDVTFSLGALEHHCAKVQQLFLSELARITRRLVVVLVPNTDSPIYKTMEEKELISVPFELVYPEEHHLYRVDLPHLCKSSKLSVVETAAIHIVPPAFIPSKYLTSESATFFSNVTSIALSAWNGNPLQTWLTVERQCSKEQKAKFGWFSYIVGEKQAVNCNA